MTETEKSANLYVLDEHLMGEEKRSTVREREREISEDGFKLHTMQPFPFMRQTRLLCIFLDKILKKFVKGNWKNKQRDGQTDKNIRVRKN